MTIILICTRALVKIPQEESPTMILQVLLCLYYQEATFAFADDDFSLKTHYIYH